ncbi:MAG: Gfo/Idh/MocA family oxidoreductase [Candidatus Cloacimonetes bacterium]|nr:Gfo/Idh/MocA family oxidoreductase [Candidatus Cloacimonadota bacterium]
MINIGIAGVGQFGQNHARILQNCPICNFVGIFDKNMKRASEIANRIGSKYFNDIESLLSQIDALAIVVTTISHYDLAKKAIESGIHVFIEKPITSTVKEAEELLTLAKLNNVQIQVGHIERFNPIVMQIADKIKDPKFIECHRIAPFTPRGTDIPVVLELMIHDIDFILAFVKSEVKEIRASGSGVITKSIDIANARIEFENGAVANITASRISDKRSRKLRIFQKNAYFSMDFKDKKVKMIKKSKHLYKVLPKILKGDYENIKKEDVVDVTLYDGNNEKKDALTTELESFVYSAEHNKKPIVDGLAGLKALEVAVEIVNKIN